MVINRVSRLVLGGLLPQYSIDNNIGLSKLGTSPITWNANTKNGYDSVKFASLPNYSSASYLISSFYATLSGINPVVIIVTATNMNGYISVRVKNITGGKSHTMDNQGCSLAYKLEDGNLNLYVPANSNTTYVTLLAYAGSVKPINIQESIPSDAIKIQIEGNV